ncbi:glutathione S-transferase GstA-like [Saccoglossus kowalevskii]|uniref:Glutathione S-transferase 3-like n=1 Tax=Saccoglossus kowalevskii TaxID=10224 RepID=A0ABM0GML4_SACKO|nr:PREDICTED: glutathione S-transferase 3-like [Saccoglossus kowalevskii]
MGDVDAEVFNTTAIGLCIGIAGGAALTLGSIGLIKYYRRTSRKPKSLKLYHSFPFRSVRCAWLVAELGVEDEVEIIEFNIHEDNPVEMEKYKREVHPHGTLPALVVDDNHTILESAAICMYLADLYGQLVPNRYARREYYNWIVYASCTMDSVLDPLYMQLTHTPEDKIDQSLIDKLLKKYHVIAAYLNNALTDREWICGERFTAADCVIGYNVWWAAVIKKGELLKDYPALSAYNERIKNRAAFKKCLPQKPPSME